MPDPFISREDLGNYLGEDLTASAKALIAVDAACDVCRNIGDQTFNAVANDVVLLDGDGSDHLRLPELPVTAVDAVSVDGIALAPSDYHFTANGDLYRVNAAAPYRRPSLAWNRGRFNISVTYDHGYAPDDLPRDVRMVALAIASRIFQQATTSGGVVEETLGAYTIRYAPGFEAGVAVTDEEVELLRAGYKPVLVA